MELTFLGTFSGVPTKQRNVSAIAIKLDSPKSWVLVDCGEGTQHQILHAPLSLVTLKAIFITHVHGDHCYGLPGLIASAAMSGRKEPLLIVAPKEVRLMFEAIQEHTQLYTPFEIIFKETNPSTSIDLESVTVTSHLLSHRVPSHGYLFSQSTSSTKLLTQKLLDDGIEKGPLWGKIQQGLNVELASGSAINAEEYLEIEQTNKSIFVAGDNDTPGILEPIAQDIDVLVHESTYTESMLEKVGPGPQHSSAKRVAQFAENRTIKNVVLTHFSARYQDSGSSGHSIDEVENEAKAIYKGNLFLAQDFDWFTLRDSGVLVKNESVRGGSSN